MKTRHQQMLEACQEFHRKHPYIWEMFERFTLERIQRGFQHYSARGVWHRIRWETAAPSALEDEQPFKLPNNHTPFYARAFMAKYPQYAGFFRTREQISKKRAEKQI
jgi:hypothetical protein